MQRPIRFLVLKSFYEVFYQISQKKGHNITSYVRIDDARIGEEKKYSRANYDSYRILFKSDDEQESFLDELQKHIIVEQIGSFEFVVG